MKHKLAMSFALTAFAAASLFLSACSDIDYHEISPEEMERRFGKNVLGHAEWVEEPLNWVYQKCDIYLMPPEFYQPEGCYESIIEHEKRHCDEGYWHDSAYHDPNCRIRKYYLAF